MYTIAKLFGKSPFAPLQTHLEKVSLCIEQLPVLFEAIRKKNDKAIHEISKKISKLEHEADLTKNDIRNHLPKSIFLPIERAALLEILSLQDSLADQAEDIGVIATIGMLKYIPEIDSDFEKFHTLNISTFEKVKEIIRELDLLLETSFGGMEAQKVKEMTEKVAYMEHEADTLQFKIIKHLYELGENLSYPVFHLWMRLIKEVAGISNISEKLANRVRMTLELK